MKSFFCSFFLLFITSNSSAQYFDLGVSLGGANYLGDLTPGSFFVSLGETHVYAGIGARLNLTDRFSFRSSVNYGEISADDNVANNLNEFRRSRNLQFRSSIKEIELSAQINLLRYEPYMLESRFTPYVTVGIGIFSFNPRALYQGEWYDLQPLGTEGQGLPGNEGKYPLTQLSIPIGGGLKFALTENLNLTVEYSMRKTFTDYLDDVSSTYPDLNELARERGEIARKLSWRTDEIIPEAVPPSPGSGRGYSDDQDWYIFAGFSITYNFIRGGALQVVQK